MRIRLVLAAVAVLVAGCGGATSGESGPSGSSSLAASGSSGQAAPPQTVVDVTISGGTVTPVNAQINATVGMPIIMHVSSDSADELHVHSVPDHEFEVAAQPNQTFQFTVDVPGQVEVELHHLDRTVAIIQVRP
jgi:hypothetical protein